MTMITPSYNRDAFLESFLHREPLPEPDDDARYWLTARGAFALGHTIDPGTGTGELVCYSDELRLYVRIR